MMVIESIKRHDPTNVGRLNKIYFMFQKDLINQNEVPNVHRRNVTVNDSINTTANSGLLSLYFTPKTDSFRESSTISKQGKIYKQTLRARIPQDRESVAATLQALHNNKMFVVYKDRNGKIKQLQNLKMTETTIISTTDNYCEISLTGKSKEKAKFWNVDGEVEVSDVVFNNVTSVTETHLIYKDGTNYHLSYMNDGDLYLDLVNPDDYPNRIIINQL